jgi:D-serine deaminase-like pyridoxal phosphate-dependent protein
VTELLAWQAFATDAGEPTWAGGSDYAWFGDEHGLLAQPAQARLHLGDPIEFVPPHCDPTVDRYDALHLVRGDTLVDVVPVDARGCTQ